MIKNGLMRFSLLGALLIFLMTACSTPRYSHNGSRSSSSTTKRYAKNTRKSYSDKAKTNRSNTNRKASVAKVDKLDLRLNVVASAEKFLGLRYKWGGKTPKSGFDCSGFTSFVMQENGVNVQGASYHQSKLGKKVSKSKVAPGDLIFFGKGSKVSHVAIVKANTGNSLEVIHSTSGSGVRVDDINNSNYWNKRYLYARQVIN
ncbi:C40 family peptidase [Saprospiraceae bacterium]|nr:C40 family peptidase [Saprospiraceae bacterium]